MRNDLFYRIALPLCAVVFLSGLVRAETVLGKGVKTSYKRYSIFRYKSEEILCEPYTVKKDDWLYKIFRKKGEISERDFPHFLLIFKELNPQISNIDAIEPGNPILIPLKKVRKKDYDLATPVDVDVPVVEFSAIPEEQILAPFIKKHTVQRGDTVSGLMDKAFLEKGGRLSEEGLKAFSLANPDVKNINIVYEGMELFLPDPSIRSETWFRSLLGKAAPPEPKTPEVVGPPPSKPVPPAAGLDGPPEPAPAAPTLDALTLLKLKEYATLVGGTLMSQGKMYFPSPDGGTQVLDLSRAPLIETSDGTKILIMSRQNRNQLLLDRIEEYWKGLKTQAMAETVEALKSRMKRRPVQDRNRTHDHKQLVQTLVAQTDLTYLPDAKIPFILNNIQLEAAFGRVIREEKADLLINFGNVFGNALDVLKKKEFQIISITPKLSRLKVAETLYTGLGYTVWSNPSFFTGARVENIKGIYAVKDKEKLVIVEKALTPTAALYMKKEAVRILRIDSTDSRP